MNWTRRHAPGRIRPRAATRAIASGLALVFLLTGCSTRYVIGQKELERAKQELTQKEEVYVRAVKADENLGDKKVWMRLRADDYLQPAGDGDAFQLAGFSGSEFPLNATYSQRNLGPAFFWPGFGILAGTSLLMVLIIGPAFAGKRWDLVIPVYGPWIGAMEAFSHAHHACDGGYTAWCGLEATGAGFGGVLSMIVSIAQGLGVGLATAGAILYFSHSSREAPSGEPQLSFTPILGPDQTTGGALTLRF